MDKTLREILPEYMGQHVRIGFNKGSGFIFCKKVSEYTEQEIDNLQKGFLAYAQVQLQLSAKDYKWMCGITEDEYVITAKKHHSVKSEKSLRRYYKYKKKSLQNTISKLSKLIRKTDIYLSSKFLKSYKSDDPTDPNDVTIILLEGNIKGDYWDEYEYICAPIPKWEPGDLSDMAYHALAAAVVKQAAADRDKIFFMPGGDFSTFMPGYDGEAVWKQILENEKEHGRWYADKKAEKNMESCDIF